MGKKYIKRKVSRVSRILLSDYDMVLIYRLSSVYEGDAVIYSLTVVKTNQRRTIKEVALLPDISRDPQRAAEIYRSFVKGTVTPMTADEIISDMLGV